jgi:hypothetical protein
MRIESPGILGPHLPTSLAYCLGLVCDQGLGLCRAVAEFNGGWSMRRMFRGVAVTLYGQFYNTRSVSPQHSLPRVFVSGKSPRVRLVPQEQRRRPGTRLPNRRPNVHRENEESSTHDQIS